MSSNQIDINAVNQRTRSEAAAALGRLGGLSTSEAKQNAARENGKKGGRKPKQNEKHNHSTPAT